MEFRRRTTDPIVFGVPFPLGCEQISKPVFSAVGSLFSRAMRRWEDILLEIFQNLHENSNAFAPSRLGCAEEIGVKTRLHTPRWCRKLHVARQATAVLSGFGMFCR